MPLALTAIDCVVAPVDHRYDTPAVAVSVTLPPAQKVVGPEGVIVGAGQLLTMKAEALVAVPPGVVTLIGPLVAPAGTVAVSCKSLMKTNAAETPLNVTDVAAVNPEPLIVTDVPASPKAGLKPEIVGALV